VVELGHWQGDDPFEENQRWSPSCVLIKGLVGNIPIDSGDMPTSSRQQPARSYDLNGFERSKNTS